MKAEIKVWQARTKAGLTLQQLAALTGIGKSTLNNIESGRCSPRLDQLITIADVCGVRVSDLYEHPLK